MTEIYLDPYLFAVPHVSEGEEAFLNYINSLLEWKVIKDESINEVFALKTTHEILFELNRYPLWEDLNASINVFGIDFIQPKDIINIVDSFLMKFKKIEDELKIDDFLLDDFFLTPKPQRYNETFIAQLANLLSLAHLQTHIAEHDKAQILLSKEINSDIIRIQSGILLIEFAIERQLELPYKFDFSITCCSNFEEYCNSLDVVQTWKKCSNEKAWKKLILISTFNLAKLNGSEIDFSHISDFTFGTSFISSIKELNFDNQEDRITMLLRSISETLLEINLNSTHALRKDSGANTSQIEVDEHKAWRRDINYEYHFHYWKKGNSYIFSKIVTHNDFSIDF